MMTQEFHKGMKVVFGRPNGEQTHGTVVKVNRKTVKVRQDESRGTQKDYAIGTEWKVAKSLCRPANGSSAPAPEAPKPKRSEAEIMDDILSVYCCLSPENLSCDGELPPAQVRKRAAFALAHPAAHLALQLTKLSVQGTP